MKLLAKDLRRMTIMLCDKYLKSSEIMSRPTIIPEDDLELVAPFYDVLADVDRTEYPEDLFSTALEFMSVGSKADFGVSCQLSKSERQRVVSSNGRFGRGFSLFFPAH